MDWIDALQDAAVRSVKLEQELHRPITLRITLAGLTIQVGDPTKVLQSDTLRFPEFEQYAKAGNLSNMIEEVVRSCAAALDRNGA